VSIGIFKKRYLIGAQLLSAAGISLILLSSNRILFALAFIVIGFSGSVTLYSGLYYTVYLIKMKGKELGFTSPLWELAPFQALSSAALLPNLPGFGLPTCSVSSFCLLQ